jgi:hypothetical protein
VVLVSAPDRRPLDVLLVEAQPHAGALASAALEEAGHRVHRCHDIDEPAFPCTAVTEPGSCPLEQPIDVALLVRGHIFPTPTPAEGAVVCALRAGVPVVEDGPDLLDPFGPFLAGRSDGDPVVACETAASHRWDGLVAEVVDRCRPVLEAHDLPDVDLACRITGDGDTLRVHLVTPVAVGARAEQALAVRAFDVVRARGHERTKVGVACSVAAPAP